MQKPKPQIDEIGSIFELANRMAMKYGTIGLLEPADVAQNAMLKVLKKEGPVNRSWLYRVVYSCAMDAGRASAKQLRAVWSDTDHDRVSAVYECPDESEQARAYGKQSTAEIDLMPRIKKMLTELTPTLRQVLVLHIEGYSHAEIASLTNTNVSTIRTRLFYARRRAKCELSDFA